ncbi:MAG: GvpL/GvpF family gas vesicle protein [candidate division NC10 bacterium]|nr:GvpL/GvpF family gas vesicle protein [candidate division NC10 bacterium]
MTDVEGHGRQMEALHLYCVVGNGMALDLRLTGLDGRQASAIRHRDIAAVMGPVPMRAYRAMKREEVIPYLFAHQAVIEKILAERTVVPVKFGTTARDEEEVRTILEKGYPQLRAALEAMGGKIELDVVALWRDLDSLLREIGEEDEIRRAKAAIATRSSEETREERVRIGQMVKARLDRRREEAMRRAAAPLQLQHGGDPAVRGGEDRVGAKTPGTGGASGCPGGEKGLPTVGSSVPSRQGPHSPGDR